VPTGAVDYQIKYAEEQIVDWLGYDRDLETYQYDPASYTAFFAASNISDEPSPAQAGTTQQHTITGLDPAKTYYFAIKSGVGSVALAFKHPSLGGKLPSVNGKIPALAQ
jgi:hypothetical protein